MLSILALISSAMALSGGLLEWTRPRRRAWVMVTGLLVCAFMLGVALYLAWVGW
jgi:hypothetical protein